MTFTTHRYTHFYALILSFFFYQFSLQAQYLICPSDIDVGNDIGACGALVTYADPDVILPFGDLELVAGLPSGSFFDIGSTTQTYVAADGSGNIATCSFVVTVNDMSDDSDCDGVGDDCDVCPGADDQVDNNGDGFPDCAVFPGFAHVINDWICSLKKKRKYFICHLTNSGFNHTICVSENAVSAHLAHGDFLGPCISCSPQRDGSTTQSKEPQVASINIFPNPSNHLVNIELQGLEAGDVRIKILNLNGQVMIEEKIYHYRNLVSYEIELDEKFNNGLYVVRATQANLSLTKSLVVMRL